jgi:hypothetical protein
MTAETNTHLVVDGFALAKTKNSSPKIGGNILGVKSLWRVRSEGDEMSKACTCLQLLLHGQKPIGAPADQFRRC